MRKLVVFGFFLHLCLILTNQAWAGPLVPFGATGDLFVLDNGSESVLRIKPDGTVSVFLTEAQITAATGESSMAFDEDNGIAFDGVVGGAMFFTEGVNESILKFSGGTLSVLTSQAAIETATGGNSADPEGIAFGSAGSLFVNESETGSVLKVNPTTGAVSVHTSEATFEALSGITSVSFDSPIIGGPGGTIFAASDGNPNVIFEIASDGTPSVLVKDGDPGASFSSLDEFMTRAPNGDLIITDDNADRILRVTTAGVVSTFLSEATLQAVNSNNVDLNGGLAFDSLGNFYVGDTDSGSILKFDTALNGSVFVSKADFKAVTGVDPDLEGGIAFAPAAVPEPGSIVLLSVCALGLVGYSWRRRKRAA